MSAIGAYMHELRSLQQHTQGSVARAAGVTERLIGSWERGQANPGMPSFLKALRFLGGHWNDVEALVISEATTEQAKRLAAMRYRRNTGELTREESAYLDSLTPDQLLQVMRFARRMSEQP